MEERITNLEIKITYMEDVVSTLNSEMIRQSKEIDFLKAEIERLKEEKNAPLIRGNEKPPHY